MLLHLFLLDLFELLIIGLITSLIYNKDKVPIYKQSAFNRWTYGVLMGAAQDGPLFQTIYGITGNGLPPVLGMLQNYVKTANSVIAGNTNILYALTNTTCPFKTTISTNELIDLKGLNKVI